jgi:type III secretion protein C
MGGPTKFIARIRALESQGAARIVSKPHVITLSDVEAILDTTSTFFVRIAGDEEVDLFNVSVGTTLRVTPHVFDADDGPQIKLLVTIEDGSTSDRQVDSIPIIDRSTVNTQALIKAGQSLLIGGLVRESKSSTVRKVPILGNIPVLGALFRSNGTSSNRVERMFLITPRLVGESSDVHTMNAPILSGTEGAILESVPLRSRNVDGALVRRDQTKPLPEPLPPVRSSVSLIPDEVAAAVEADRKRQAARPEPTRMPTLRERLLRNLDKQPAPGPGQELDVNQDLIARKKAPVPEIDDDDDDGWIEIPSSSAAGVEVRPIKTRAPADVADDFPDWQEVN